MKMDTMKSLAVKSGIAMKHFLACHAIVAALAILLLLATTPALADYKTCMKHCMTKHDFDHCQPICAPAKPVEICKLSDEEQYELVEAFMDENYDSEGGERADYPPTDNGIFSVEYRPTNSVCKGKVKLNSNCEVVRHNKFECEYTGWTDEAKKRQAEWKKEEEERKKREEAERRRLNRIKYEYRATVMAYVDTHYPRWNKPSKRGDAINLYATKQVNGWVYFLLRFYNSRMRSTAVHCVLELRIRLEDNRIEDEGWTASEYNRGRPRQCRYGN